MAHIALAAGIALRGMVLAVINGIVLTGHNMAQLNKSEPVQADGTAGCGMALSADFGIALSGRAAPPIGTSIAAGIGAAKFGMVASVIYGIALPGLLLHQHGMTDIAAGLLTAPALMERIATAGDALIGLLALTDMIITAMARGIAECGTTQSANNGTAHTGEII
jgi:hypothetical protein